MAVKKQSTRKPSGRPVAKKAKTLASKPKKPAARRPASSRPASAARPAKPAPKKSAASPRKAPATKAAAAKPAALATSRAQPASAFRQSVVRGLTGRRADMQPVRSSVGLIHGIPPYQAKAGETYMNERQLEHFRQILLAWKRELMEEVDRTVHHMQDEASNFPDPNDRATQESEFGLELRTRDRERKLLKKIDSALARIDDGSYGYCEETGEEIGLRRLEARPVATLSVEAQERRELAERQFRDREDGN